VDQKSIASALGIQHGGDPWWRRAACIGQPWAIFFHEAGSQRGSTSILDDRAKRICVRCPVRRQCLEDAYQAESSQQTIARNAARTQGPWFKASRSERQLPIGVFGGTTPKERWDDTAIHHPDCKQHEEHENYSFSRDPCRGCRPIHERIALLEERLSKQAPRFLRSSEKIVPLE
jgi:hypothetical protein